MELTLTQMILLGLGVLQLAALAGISLALYQFRKHRKFIGSLSADYINAKVISPEVKAEWKKKIKYLGDDSPKYRAYKRSLQQHGEWDEDNNRPKV